MNILLPIAIKKNSTISIDNLVSGEIIDSTNYSNWMKGLVLPYNDPV